MRHSIAIVLGVLLGLAVAGCASHGSRSPALQPGTGDISFRLRWQGETDLDLHVVDPLERHTGIDVLTAVGSTEEQLAAMRRAMEAQIEAEHARRAGESGASEGDAGILDIDCNASPHQLCADPIENVYWPEGTALPGNYTFWVHLFQPILDSAEFRAVDFAIEIRRGARVVEVVRGTLDNASRTSETFAHAYVPEG